MSAYQIVVQDNGCNIEMLYCRQASIIVAVAVAAIRHSLAWTCSGPNNNTCNRSNNEVYYRGLDHGQIMLSIVIGKSDDLSYFIKCNDQ